MSIFDDRAKDAAIDCYRAAIRRGVVERIAIVYALNAAEASLRERGRMRDASCCQGDNYGGWTADTAGALPHYEAKFPVAIIRIGDT